MSAVAGELFEHGIQTENSDVRAHVCPTNKTVYVFPTANARRAIEEYAPRLASAGQPGVIGRTAEGWLCRIEWIADLRRLLFVSWPRWGEFRPDLSTSAKGSLAVACVLDAMRLGRFPFWVDASEDERQDVQVKGTDILVFCRKRVQVKCDYPTASTGNLFLQKAEKNPLRRF